MFIHFHCSLLFHASIVLFLTPLCNCQDPQPCPENPIQLTASDFSQFIYSPYDERKNYPPNTDCRFLLIARNSQRRIHINIIESSLEEPLFTDCDDYVTIRDGSLPTSDELYRWCGTDHPISVTSSGQSLYIHFHSDSIIQRRGFNLSFVDFDLPGCPVDWESDTENEYCYKLFLPPYGATWIEAQRQCTFEKANLLTISNTNEYSKVTNLFSQQHTFPWIGYNDAENEGQFVSVDPATPMWPDNFPTFNDDHLTKDCVYMDWNIKDGMAYNVDDCRTRHSFICKKRTDGSTIPVAPPTNLVRSGVNEAGMNNTMWLLIIALIALLLIILLIVYWLFKKNYNNKVGNVDLNQRLVSNLDGSRGSSIRTSRLEVQKQTIKNTQINSGQGAVGLEATSNKTEDAIKEIEKNNRRPSAENKKAKKDQQRVSREQVAMSYGMNTDSENSARMDMMANSPMPAAFPNAQSNLSNLTQKSDVDTANGQAEQQQLQQRSNHTVIEMAHEADGASDDYFPHKNMVESDNPDDEPAVAHPRASDDESGNNIKADSPKEASRDGVISQKENDQRKDPERQLAQNLEINTDRGQAAPVTTGLELLVRPTFPHSLVGKPTPESLRVAVGTETDLELLNEEIQTEGDNDMTIMSAMSDDFDGMEMSPMNPHTQKKQRHMHILNNIDAKTEKEFWS